jgi:crotonobetainyl-CoA:carnitine CoA-transferase CaiB-like acyl-CoA transferase
MDIPVGSLLSGYRVLDISAEMGAFCGKFLRDLGLDVIKIEPPKGDPLRSHPPFAEGHDNPEGSLRFAYLNAGKQGITLDLEKPGGRELLLKLVEQADVVIESYPPGYLKSLDLDFPVLKERQEKLIVVGLSGFGQTGPYAHFRAPDIVTTAMSGLLYVSGTPELPPCMPPETQSYYYASIYAAFGAMLALWRREETGQGVYIDASVQASMAIHEHVAFTYSAEGKLVKRAGSQHQHVAPANLFRCKDGYIAIFATHRHWPILLEVWEDHPEELDDPRWKTDMERRKHADRLNPLIESFTSRYEKEELSDLLQKRGIPGLPVNAPSDFRRDPHIQERGFFGSVDHSEIGSFEQLGVPFTVDEKRAGPSPAPTLGQHNEEVYGQILGLKQKELEALTSEGVIGRGNPESRIQKPEFQTTWNPLVEDQRPAEQTMSSTNDILKGIRVIAFTNAYAGPYAGRLMAQYGAEVIKVESATGGLDTFRHFGKDVDSSPRFIECNLGVRSITLNLKHPAGVQAIKDLTVHADVILENFRPGVLNRLGLGEEVLREINPGLIILRMPGLGDKGPKSGYGTWGFNLTAYSGMTYLWNHPDQERPIGSQGVYPDHLSFILAPTLLVAALLRRRVTGTGVTMDLAQAEAAAYALGVSYLDTAVNGKDPEPQGNRDPMACPQGCYPCRGEDRWCVISVRGEDQWSQLCSIMGQEELARDPRFADLEARFRHAAELDNILKEWTRSRTPEEIMNRLQSEGIAAGVVENGADLMEDPQLRHRDYFLDYPESTVGAMEIPRSGLKFSEMTDGPVSFPPRLGHDTEEILRDLLGYDEETINQLKSEGVLS